MSTRTATPVANQPTDQPTNRGGYVSGWHAGPTPWRCTGTVRAGGDREITCHHPDHDRAQPVREPVHAVTAGEYLPGDARHGSGQAWRTDTPTGVLLVHAEPESDLWFAQRRAGITATDLPKILGLSGWGNALSVWLDKRGQLNDDGAGEAALWGTLLEDVVAAEWARRNSVQVHRLGVMRHAEQPWQRASLDRLVTGCPDADGGPCAVEVKTRSAYVAGRWREQIPDDVYAQTAWQRIVTGLPHVHVAVLLGGQRLEQHRYDPDPGVEAQCLTEAAALWDAVGAGVPPVVEPDDLLADLLDRVHPDRAGVLEVPGDLLGDVHRLIDERRDALAAAAEANTRAERARAGLVQVLGGHEVAHDGGRELYRYRASTRRATKWREVVKAAAPAWRDDLAALVAEHTTTSTVRSLILPDPTPTPPAPTSTPEAT